MSTLVANLLDMARIQSGEVKFNRQWQSIEEVVGSALSASAMALGDRQCSRACRPICRWCTSTPC